MKRCVVIIPALNEEKTIGDVIEAIPNKLFDGRLVMEVVVINDGSTDSTSNIAKEHGAAVISHLSTQGVGASFFDGIKEALNRKADYAVNIDGDGQMNPIDIEKLLIPIWGGVADMVTASRFINKDNYPDMPAIKLWGNNKVAKIVSSIVGQKYYDVSCGFRAYNKEALLRLNLFGKYTYTQETFINLAACRNIKIMEMPVKIRGEREFGKSRVAYNVPKYAIRSGAIILSAYKDYKPLQFFGLLSLICFIIGFIFESIMFSYFFATGHFRHFLWAGLIGAFFAIAAMIFLIIMIVSDTLSKIKQNEEELLYFSKKKEYYGNNV